MKIKGLLVAMCAAIALSPTTRAASVNVLSLVSSTTNTSAFIPQPLNVSVYSLMAGQHINVGTLTAFTTATGQLVVTYRTVGPWSIKETHLDIGLSVQALPQTKSGNPQPGKFSYGGPQARGTTAIQYVFDWGPSVPHGTVTYIGAHGVVVGPSTETFWSAGGQFSGSNWFTYSTYVRPPLRVLEVTKSFDPDPLELGTGGTDGEFVVNVTNSGPTDAAAVTVTDILDERFEGVVASVDTGNGSCVLEGQALTCTMNGLLVGQTEVVRVSFHLGYIDGNGTIGNCATATDGEGASAKGCATLRYTGPS